MSTSSSVKRPDSLLHSKTGEQPPSPKRIRGADESDEFQSETDTQCASTGAMDAGSSSASSESKQSKSSFQHCNVHPYVIRYTTVYV